MQGCILKIQVRFCLQHSDSGGGERMSQLSRRHGPKWREWNINDESIRAELKDSNAAKPTPYHGERRAMLLLLRNTFFFFFCAGEMLNWSNLLHCCISRCRKVQYTRVPCIVWWRICIYIIPFSILYFGQKWVMLVKTFFKQLFL